MSKPPQELHRLQQMPVTYPRIYLDLARERGIEPALVLRKAGLEPALFADPRGKISLQQHFQLIGAVLELTGDPGLGLELGCRAPLTIHGTLGYALMCCSTLGEAASLLQRFWRLRGRGIEIAFLQEDDWNIVQFQATVRLPPHLHRTVFDFILSSSYRGFQFLVGSLDFPTEIWFDYPQPDYFARFRDRLPTIRYNMPLLQIRVQGRDLLNQRLPMSDPEALSLAITQCEKEYALLDTGPEDALGRVKALLSLSGEGYPSLETLAAQLNLSPRSFRRRLQSQGTSYRQLLEEARRRDAIHLLGQPDLEIQKIAGLLGYTDPANFTRAFRQWTGQSPSQYRKLLISAS